MSLQPTADTKKLRNMFNENGIKWTKSMYLKDTLVDCETTWEYNGIKWCAYESPYGGLILRTVDYTLAPEQVVKVMCATEATKVIRKTEAEEMRVLDKLRELVLGLKWCSENYGCKNLCPLYDKSEPEHCREERFLRELGIEAE